MKKIFIIPFLLLSLQAFSQVFTPQTAAGYQFKRGKFDSTIYIPTFCGVPTLRSITPQRQAAIGFDSCNHLFYFYDPKTSAWEALGGGGSTINVYNDTTIIICPVVGSCDTVYSTVIINDLTVLGDSSIVVCPASGACDTIPINTTITGTQVVFFGKNSTGDSTILLLSNGTRFAASDNSPPCTTRNGIISGGIVTWLHDYVYNVSEAYYNIDCVTYHSLSTDITLSAADATLDRIDLFNLTTSNTAVAITGTPGSGIPPDYDANLQLNRSFALVTANTTEPPGQVSEWIYKENVEWTTATGAGTINPNSLVNPYAGSKDIQGTNVLNSQYITFTSPTVIQKSLYDVLTFQIRSKGNFGTTKKLVLRWFDAPSTATGANVPIGSGSYGFVSTQTSSYQTITIPLSDFAGPGGIDNATILRLTEVNTSGNAGWYIDNIQLQKTNTVTTGDFVSDVTKNTRGDTFYIWKNGSIVGRLKDGWDSVSIYNLTNSKLTASDTTGLWQQQGRYEVHHEIINDSVSCTTYSDSTVQCDTSRIAFTQENITYITNIIEYHDSLKGPDTTGLHKDIPYGPLDMYVAYDPLGRVDTIHYRLDSASASQAGYMTPYQWSRLGTGGTTIDTTSLSNRINLKQPQLNGTGFVKASGTTISYDNSTYLTGNQAITVTATGDATGTSTSSATAPSLPLVLATVNSNVGTFTNATVTTNGKGLITAISNGSAAGNFANSEEKSGSTSSTITLSHTYTSGTIKMWKNGVRMQAADFIEATGTTITLNVARLSYDFFTFDYQY